MRRTHLTNKLSISELFSIHETIVLFSYLLLKNRIKNRKIKILRVKYYSITYSYSFHI